MSSCGTGTSPVPPRSRSPCHRPRAVRGRRRTADLTCLHVPTCPLTERERRTDPVTENAADRRAPVPGLGGTGYLADDLYLMSHHERTGKPVAVAACGRVWVWPERCWPN